ncbi:uncharacterized protein LOC141607101 [Silene latifolia]|uniref:uncharacterized protein LOC141607101 n=1 Tax=Silene latifolia TaxID=37657 RepID=UPI003D776F6E
MIGNVVSRARTKISSKAFCLNLVRAKSGGRPPFSFNGDYRDDKGQLKYKLCTDASHDQMNGTKAYGAILMPLKTHKPLLKFGDQISDPTTIYSLMELIGMVGGGLELNNRFPEMLGVLVCNDSANAVKHIRGDHVLESWKFHPINDDIARLKLLMPDIDFVERRRYTKEMQQAHNLANEIRKKTF